MPVEGPAEGRVLGSSASSRTDARVSIQQPADGAIPNRKLPCQMTDDRIMREAARNSSATAEYIYRGYKTELEPTALQQQLMARHCGARRFAYNWGLQRKMEEYGATGRTPSAIDLHRELNRRKKTDLGWLYQVSKCAPQERLRDLDAAFANFFRSLKKGDRRMRYPRFKRRRSGLGSFRVTNKIVVQRDRIRLPRIGYVRLKERDYLPAGAHILSATVSERAGRWFVSVRVRALHTWASNQGPVVGVDLGVLARLISSDGRRFPNPPPSEHAQRSLRRLQRAAARRQRGSKNRDKTYARISRLLLRIRNTRHDAIHKATTELTKTNSVIGVEDLAVANLIHGKLARRLSEAALRETRRQLEYKAVRYGSRIVVADRFFPSSRRCSQCGAVRKDLSLSERVYACAACGFTCDRDLNAARNLLFVAARSAETRNACGADGSGRLTPMKPSAVKQEPAEMPLVSPLEIGYPT
jgi:putative transposase